MKVAIIHPWLPQYRVPFFDQLTSDGRDIDIDFEIFHGEVPPEWISRGDSESSRQYSELRTRTFPLVGRSFNYKSIAQLGPKKNWDLVIAEQAVRNIETYELLTRRYPVAFWGHGRTYTKRVSRLQERVKTGITGRGRWFFSYTEGGAAAVRESGFPSDRVTVVQNSIDTTALSRDLAAVTDRDVEEFRALHNLNGPTALFLGGLDESKRLPFLLEATSLIRRTIPSFNLIVAGDGSQRELITRAAETNTHIHYAGKLAGHDKATALRTSDVIAMPGRVGLLAVDSFTARRPIVTTDWPWHAPEFEYLSSSQNAIVSDDDVGSYAAAIVSVLREPKRLAQLQDACGDAAPRYSIEEMSRRFTIGVSQALERGSR